MIEQLLKKLQDTVDNPSFYRALTPEEQAELFLYLFAPKPKLFKKPKVIQGIDGKTPKKDKDYLSKESSEELIKELTDKTHEELEEIIEQKLSSITPAEDGKDAEITEELVERIAEMAQALIVLPDFPTLITMEPEAIRNALELLPEGEKLAQEAIEGLPEKLKELENRPTQQAGGVSKNMVLQLIEENSTGGTVSFETVSKNLSAFPNELTYTGENLTSIEYTTDLGTVTKTLAYTGENLTSITLSGNLPNGVTDTVKTLAYTGENLTSITYA